MVKCAKLITAWQSSIKTVSEEGYTEESKFVEIRQQETSSRPVASRGRLRVQQLRLRKQRRLMYLVSEAGRTQVGTVEMIPMD